MSNKVVVNTNTNQVTVIAASEQKIISVVAAGPKGDKGADGSAFSGTLTGSLNVSGSINLDGILIVSENIIGESFTGSLFGTSSYSTQAISSSYALTASYALNAGGGGGDSFPYTGSAIISGSLEIIGNLNLTGSFNFKNGLTGSILGTSSFADNALSSSYVKNAETASFVSNAVSSSFAFTASNVEYENISNKPSLVSGSSQVQLNQISGTTFADLPFTFPNDLVIQGNLTAEQLIVSNSVYFVTTSFYSGSTIFGNSLDDTHQFTGSINVNGGITASLFGTSSFAVDASTSSYYLETDPIFVVKSGSLATTGSNIFVGNQSITGSLLISGSTFQLGNNRLQGNTTLSGSIIISGSSAPGSPTASVQIYGDIRQTGYHQFNPVTTTLDNSISASYIYVSGSTNDLYFTQNGEGYTNTTRLRWLEGNLYTGLLHGGIISATLGTNTYKIGSGSGIIVNLNTSFNKDPYPTVQFLNWEDLTNTIDSLSGSYDQSFVSILSNGTIGAQGTPYNDGDYNTKIPIGIVIHQNRTNINAFQTFPSVAYGWKQRTFDFFKAFGPLKISGYTLSPSGSSTGGLVLSGGTAWVDGRNYTLDPNNPSYIQEAAGITTSKIFRYRQSGSNWVYDTNGGAGYTTIDPANYSNNGTLTAVPVTNWSIQRVYYFPNSATKAFYIYYGNAVYANEAAALAAVATEPFSESPNTAANAIYVGYMLLRNNADFTNATTYDIYQSGLFRASGAGGGAGGGGGATALVALTDVSISSPTDYQPLVYNNITTKWENRSTISGSLIGNASTSTTASFAFTSSFIEYENIANKPSLFSGSSQVQLNEISGTTFADSIFTFPNDVVVQGNVIAEQLIVSSSVYFVTTSFSSGSTIFGNSSDDIHQFTGSIRVLGAITGSISASNLVGDIILGTQTSGQYASTITGGSGLTATAANANDGTAYTIDAVAGLGISLTAPTNDAINIDTGSTHFTGGVTNRLNTLNVLSGSVSSPSQGTISVGGFANIDLGLQSGDDVTFNKVTATNGLTGSLTASSLIGDIRLGTQTSGDYVQTLTQGTGVTITSATGEGSNPTIAIGQAVGTTSNVQFNQITASIISASQFTGSLFGTASWARNSITSSYVTGSIYTAGNLALSASFALNGGVTSFNTRTGAITLTAGDISGLNAGIISSSAFTASWAQNALTASSIGNLNQNVLITGSVIISGSAQVELFVLGDQQITGSLRVTNGIVAQTITGSLTGSLTGILIGTSSWSRNSISSSYVTGSIFIAGNLAFSSSHAISSSTSISSSFARTSSYVEYSNVANKPSLFSGSSQVQLDGISGTTFADLPFTFPNDLVIQGNLTAEQLIISSSVYFVTTSFSSGSTIFGNSSDDIHQFTGSIRVNGSITGSISASNLVGDIRLGTQTSGDYVSTITQGTGVIVNSGTGEGSTPTISIGQSVDTTSNVQFNQITASIISASQFIGNLSGTASVANNAVTASYIATASWAINSITASYAEAVLSSSYVPNLYITSSTTAPASPVDNELWYDSDSGKTYIRYNDGTSTQWVLQSDPTIDVNTSLQTLQEVTDLGAITDKIVTFANSTNSNSTSSGALLVSGGAGFGLDVHARAFYGDGSGLTGIIATATNVGDLQQVTTGGNQTSASIYVTNTTNSTSKSTGAIRTLGGIGVEKDIWAERVIASSFTGSLNGTSSHSENSISASFVTGSIFNSSNIALSASYSVTSSYALNGGVTSFNTRTGGITLQASDISALNAGIVSASSFTSPSQGTLRATINGVQTDVDLGVQTGDNVTFNTLTATNGLTGSVTASSLIGDIRLGTQTSGDYVRTLTQGTGVTITSATGEGSNPTIAIGQAVETTSNVQFNNITGSIISASNHISGGQIIASTGFTGSLSSSFLKGAILNSQLQNSSVTVGSTAISLGSTVTTVTGLVSLNSTSITASFISASGGLTGSLTSSFLIGDVRLGTQTSGDYVSTLTQGTGVTITGATGEGSNPTISIGQAVATTSNVQFNQITASIISASQFTGSLFGTASWARNSITSSFVTGSIFTTGNIVQSASFALTASYALNAAAGGLSGTGTTNRIAKFTNSTIIGDSNLFDDGNQIQISGSIRVSGSLEVTGSLNAPNITGSLFGTASFSNNALSASFVTGSIFKSGNLALSASYAFSQIKTKAGSVGGATFAGNPKKATVTFGTAFVDTNYSVVVTGEDSRTWTIESKVAGSFVINSNSNTAFIGNAYWMATAYGETS